jgi:hypothetical protein
VAGAIGWVTLTAWPATVSAPDRSGPAFAAADTPMLPLPVPDAGAAIDSQSLPAVTVADHVHDGSLAVIAIPDDPPAAGSVSIVGATLNVQGGGGGGGGGGSAAWVTLTV